ncbi:MAG: methyl-accepting chemotaxis protein, partial [Pseudomonadota bacterium]|nr:methyl-accepting chemotaxis protein [Pseudomonadota bacterium]
MIRQYSVGVRAAGAFGLIGLLLLALGLFALDRLSSVVEQMDFITDEQVPAIDNVNDLDREFLRVRVHSANVAAYINDEQRKQAYVERLDDANQSLERNLDEYEALLNDAESKKLFKELKANLNEYWQLNDQFMQLVNAKLVEPIASLRESTILPLTNKISTNLDKLLAHEMELINTATDTAGDVSSAAFTGIVVALVVVLVLTVLFAWVLTQSIVKPIQQAVDFSKTIAERDLTHSIEIDGKDEPAQLLKQLRKTQEELRQSIGHIAQSSQQLASTSEELSSVTEDSTRTIQQQTEELEQAATAVNELTTAVENVAQDAQSASEASEAADEQAQFGNDRVAKTVTAIEELSQEIGDSSSNVTELADKVTGITKVLEVIRGIAEQTNLLALNAAIEAARAGESGRGFAVVADEVRSLAHKTQQSTVEIEEMVSAINESSDRSVSTMKQSLERAAKTL